MGICLRYLLESLICRRIREGMKQRDRAIEWPLHGGIARNGKRDAPEFLWDAVIVSLISECGE
jgi:hypothetical protein